MSIRLIARDLYHLIQAVERLEARWVGARPDERERLADELRRLRSERDRLRRMLAALQP
jgi:hypothetical protein